MNQVLLTQAQATAGMPPKILILVSLIVLAIGFVLWAWGAKYLKVLLGLIGAGLGLGFGSIAGLLLLSGIIGPVAGWLAGAIVSAVGFAFVGVAYPRFSTAMFSAASLGFATFSLWTTLMLPSSIERSMGSMLASGKLKGFTKPTPPSAWGTSNADAFNDATMRIAGVDSLPPEVLEMLKQQDQFFTPGGSQKRQFRAEPTDSAVGTIGPSDLTNRTMNKRSNGSAIKVLPKATTKPKPRVSAASAAPVPGSQSSETYKKGLAIKQGMNSEGGKHVTIRSAKQEMDIAKLDDLRKIPEHVLAAEKLAHAEKSQRDLEAKVAAANPVIAQTAPAPGIADLAMIAALDAKSAGNLAPNMLALFPWRDLALGIFVALLLAVGAFVGAFVRPRIAACVVTGTVGAAWILSAVSAGAAGVPGLNDFFDLPLITWIILWVGLAGAGVFIQMNQMKRAMQLVSDQALLVARPLPSMGPRTGDIMPPSPG